MKKERENGGEYSRERTNDDGNIDDDENAFESPEGGFDVDDDERWDRALLLLRLF